MCAIIWVSELATPSPVLASVLPASPLAPERVSEPSSRMFSGAYEPGAGGATVAVERLESSVTMAEICRDTMPESARDLIAHSQPVAVNTSTATSATAIRPAISSRCSAVWVRGAGVERPGPGSLGAVWSRGSSLTRPPCSLVIDQGYGCSALPFGVSLPTRAECSWYG